MKLFIIFCFFSSLGFAQVGIGTTNPQATLDVRVTDPDNPTNEAGIAVPQVNILPISGNRAGQIVYLTIDNKYYFYNGTNWGVLTLSTTVVQNFNNPNTTEVISTQGIIDNLKDLLPKTWAENDNANRTFSTTTAEGFTTQTVTIRDGFECKYKYNLPFRNNSTSWGGGYTIVDVSVNNGVYTEIVNMGYQDAMVNGSATIRTSTRTVIFERGQYGIPLTGDYSISVRLRHRSYNGTLLLNQDRGDTTVTSSSYHEFSEFIKG